MRRTKEQIQAARRREWEALKVTGHCGHRVCTGCGRVAYTCGKRKTSAKCEQCFVGLP